MNVLLAMIILIVGAGDALAEQVMCQRLTHCPCGSTNKYVTICAEVGRKDDHCNRWSKCKTCKDGLDRCLECPEELEGPLCTMATRREMYHQKRQFHSHPLYGKRPRRSNSPVQEGGNAETVYCLNPGTISNGQVVYYPPTNNRLRVEPQITLDDPEYPRGGRLEYSCDIGYYLEGSTFLTCEAYGDWSTDPPACRRDIQLGYCRNPGSISNGRVVYYPPQNSRQRTRPQTTLDDQEYPEEGRLQYTCNNGYILEGSNSLICEANGDWSADPPLCRRVSEGVNYCNNPGPILNGKVVYVPTLNERRRPGSLGPDVDNEDYEAYPRGSRLQYSCDSGYSLDGASSLTCETSGLWSADPPTCITISGEARNIVRCINPGPILNGIIRYYAPMARFSTGSASLVSDDTLELSVGTRLEYDCDDGYIADGTSSLTCQSSGIWTALPPKCVPDCGYSVMATTRRILHGNTTIVGEWPWVVGIALRESNFTGQVICGGAILNSETIITAAHCLPQNRRFALYFGKHYRNNRLDDLQVLSRMSDRVIIHPNFVNETLDSDIALIKFKPKMRFSERVQPICLPTTESTARNIVTGRKGYVTGWGYTERRLGSSELLMAHLPVLANDPCRESFRQNVPNLNLVLTQNMFCAGFSDARQSTCIGDSGSPIVFYDKETDRYTLEGLVSFGVEGQCGLPGTYSVFTRVNRFLPWIYRNI